MGKAKFRTYRQTAPKFDASIYPRNKPMSKVVAFTPRAANQTETAPEEQKRWSAELVYRDAGGGSWSLVTFEEISGLHDIIEQGPDWNTLVSCTITLAIRTPSTDRET